MAFKAVNDFGMDAEIAAKMAGKYDKGLEQDVQQWVEDVTNIAFDKPFGEMLKDGTVLVELVNKIMPGRIKKWAKTPKNLFQMQENISAFLRVCREIGVAEASLFAANTLSHVQDLNQVVTCIVAFNTALQRNKQIKFDGPFVKGTGNQKNMAKRPPSKRWEIGKSSSVATKLNMGSHGIMEQNKHVDAREMIKSKKLAGNSSNGSVSLLNQGSHGIMEQNKHVDAREMIKENKLKGSSANGSVSLLNQGSHGIMESSKYSDPREMIKRKQLDGSGNGNGSVSMLNQGSHGIMESNGHVDAREMIKNNEL